MARGRTIKDGGRERKAGRGVIIEVQRKGTSRYREELCFSIALWCLALSNVFLN